MEINTSDVVLEVTARFEAYERALLANDLDALNRFFWDSPLVVRYGFADVQHGANEVAAFRAALARQTSPRELFDTSVLALGRDTAVVNTQFTIETDATDPNSGRRGRQSQVWIRIDEEWKVASAHVSWPA